MIRTVPETLSTNADLIALAGSVSEGTWLRAERQTGGRGRMGREWVSPPGNLYTSTIVQIMPGDPAPSTLGFVAAIALAEVLAAYAQQANFTIKWPNDILAQGCAKISGILLERTGETVVVGIGVNLASAPELEGRETISLSAITGSAADPQDFLETLAEAFARTLADWRGKGLGPILARWQERAHPLGTALGIFMPDGERIEGQFQGLDNAGALKLRLANGAVRAIHAGDVFLI